MKRALIAFLAMALIVSAIGFAASEYAPLQKGSKGNAVAQLQTRLKELGFYSISVDGDYGNGTEKAVKAFEAYNGLEETGIASAELQALLFSDEAKGIPVPDVEISDVGLRKSYGYYFARPSFVNHTESTIDSITVLIKAYNAYGERIGYDGAYTINDIMQYDGIDDYNLDDSTVEINGLKIKPDGRYSLNGNNEMDFYSFDSDALDTVYLAISRYHTTDGEMVDITENDQIWYGSDGKIVETSYPNGVKPVAELTRQIEEDAESYMLGLTACYISNFFAEVAGVPCGGVYVDMLEDDSILKDAGVREGDILVKIGDVWVYDEDSLVLAKGLAKDCDSVSVVFYHRGERLEAEISPR